MASSVVAPARMQVARPVHAASAVRLPSSVVAPRPFVPHSQQLRRRSTTCNGLFGLGLPELAVIAGVAVLIWGPSKLPDLGKGLGKTVKSFQSAAKEFETELKAASSDEPAKVGEPGKVEDPKKKEP